MLDSDWKLTMESISDDHSGTLQKTNDDLQRSRSPLETVAEETEGYQPILVTPKTEWNLRPLVVEDSNRVLLAPSLELTLRYFFTHCGKDVTEISRSDLMIVLIYVVALETGFTPKGSPMPAVYRSEKHHCYRSFDQRLVKHFATQLPMDWLRRRAGPYQLEMELVHEASTRENLSCSLVAFCSGDMLIANLLPSVGKATGASFSTVIPISFHVPSVNSTRLPISYQYLQGLSLKLKNELFVPFRNLIFLKFVPIVNPSLLGLPQELVNKIKSYLDHRSKQHLLEVFKIFGSVYESERR
ncbi:uncharacterized protein LOC128724967 [Anopheles nili]|uniref:uncharacterized protein LOC128724967 n=1 Tax=Anopheles nili TaxID=185578 RepID=UPI00237BA8F9|nr:uncharacterized protein LOC128724967 [Anopheles nili]